MCNRTSASMVNEVACYQLEMIAMGCANPAFLGMLAHPSSVLEFNKTKWMDAEREGGGALTTLVLLSVWVCVRLCSRIRTVTTATGAHRATSVAVCFRGCGKQAALNLPLALTLNLSSVVLQSFRTLSEAKQDADHLQFALDCRPNQWSDHLFLTSVRLLLHQTFVAAAILSNPASHVSHASRNKRRMRRGRRRSSCGGLSL